MKQLVAAVTVAAVLLAGGSAAWAQSGGSGGSGATGGAAQQGRRRGRAVLKDAVNAAAKEIGVSVADLKQARKDGKSIAQVAKDHDKSVDDVVNAVVKQATSDIDQAVKDGKLDSKKADQIKQKLPDRAKQLVNREPKQRGAGTTTTTTQS